VILMLVRLMDLMDKVKLSVPSGSRLSGYSADGYVVMDHVILMLVRLMDKVKLSVPSGSR